MPTCTRCAGRGFIRVPTDTDGTLRRVECPICFGLKQLGEKKPKPPRPPKGAIHIHSPNLTIADVIDQLPVIKEEPDDE